MPRRFHQWTGIVLGIPLVILGVGGASLVYREKIERSAKPVPLTVEPRGRAALPIDEIAARMREQNPGFHLTHFQIPPRPNGPLELVLRRGAQTLFAAADPFTGKDLGLLQGGIPTPLEPVRRFHGNWLLGTAGRQLNAALSLVLAALVLTGWFLFLFRDRRPWHAWLGLIVSIPLLLTALSGTLLIWGRMPIPATAATGSTPVLPLSAYESAARQALPGSSLSWIALSDPVNVRLRLPTDWQRRGSNEVHLHPETAKVLRIQRFQDASFQRRLYVALTAIHYGEWGGAPGRLLWSLTGLSIAILWITGLGYLFLRKMQRGSD